MTLLDRIVATFEAQPDRWIDGRDLAQVGGFAAWRSRVSDARRRGMVITNRQRSVKHDDGTHYTITEYKFSPPSDDFRLTA